MFVGLFECFGILQAACNFSSASALSSSAKATPSKVWAETMPAASPRSALWKGLCDKRMCSLQVRGIICQHAHLLGKM